MVLSPAAMDTRPLGGLYQVVSSQKGACRAAHSIPSFMWFLGSVCMVFVFWPYKGYFWSINYLWFRGYNEGYGGEWRGEDHANQTVKSFLMFLLKSKSKRSKDFLCLFVLYLRSTWWVCMCAFLVFSLGAPFHPLTPEVNFLMCLRCILMFACDGVFHAPIFNLRNY